MRWSSKFTLLPLLVTVGLSAGSAAGSWSSARSDVRRSGLAVGTSDIVTPAPLWRTFLGGALNAYGVVADVDGDGSDDVVLPVAGKLVAKTRADKVLWETGALELLAIVGIHDLDGDGKPEIVALRANQVVVLDLATGAVRWTEAEGEIGTVGAVRVADFDGDGKADVLVQECVCCEVASGKPGFVYSFAAGLDKPKLLYGLPFSECTGGGRSTTVFDADGDGQLDVSLATYTTISVVHGKTGAVLATSPDLGEWTMRSQCIPADVDGVVGQELICARSTPNTAPGLGHRLFALKYNAATKALTVLWQRDVGTIDGALHFPAQPVGDLDGDGTLELVVGAQDAGGALTVVLDPKTGAELATRPSFRPVGTWGSKTGRTVVGVSIGSTVGAAYAAKALTTAWTIASAEPLTYVDLPTWSRQYNAERLFGSGALLVVRTPTSALQTFDVSASSGPTTAGTFAFPAGVAPGLVWTSNGKIPTLVAAGDDGVVRLLDEKLGPTSPPTLRIGGYYASGAWRAFDSNPVVASLGAKGDSVLARSSNGNLLRIDALEASRFVNPVVKWRSPHTTAPVVVEKIDGTNTGIVCRRLKEPLTTPPAHQVATLSPAGTVLWAVPVEAPVFNDVLPIRRKDGTTALAFHWGRDSDYDLHTRALDGSSGSTLWNAVPIGPGPNRQPAGFAVADWNGDGVDDLILQAFATRVLDGTNGVQIATGPNEAPYFMPIVSDVTGDGALDVVLHGGYYPLAAYEHDLSKSIFVSTESDAPFPYGSLVTCGTSKRLVSTSLSNVARIKVTTIASGATTTTTSVLAAGKRFPDEASVTAAKARLSQLGSTSAHSNLTGKGRPTVVVGSQDGWLYGFNPCDSTLDFAVELRAPVGAIAFGDTNADGRDEIIASVADGYLYALGQPGLGAPTEVLDTLPSGTTDIDETNSVVLHARWTPVTGADKYEVAVVDNTGEAVAAPVWTVTSGTSIDLPPLPLVAGGRYQVVVRAVDATGRRGADGASDGVVFLSGGDAGDAGTDTGTPDGDAGTPDGDAGDAGEAPPAVEGGGCGCFVGRSTSSTHLALALLVPGLTFAIARRRRGTRSNSRAPSRR